MPDLLKLPNGRHVAREYVRSVQALPASGASRTRVELAYSDGSSDRIPCDDMIAAAALLDAVVAFVRGTPPVALAPRQGFDDVGFDG